MLHAHVIITHMQYSTCDHMRARVDTRDIPYWGHYIIASKEPQLLFTDQNVLETRILTGVTVLRLKGTYYGTYIYIDS